MSSPSHNTAWKISNRAAIKKRLEPLCKAAKMEKIIQGDLQGIFLRKKKDELEMYCYDNETHKLSDIMSRIDLTHPLKLIVPYTQAVFLSAFWQNKEPDNIYIAGFGGGRLAMLFHHYFSGIDIHGADIDPNALTVSKEYFGLSEDALKHVNAADSREDLCTRETLYDIIFLDVFAGSGEHINHLATTEFFQLCQKRLTEQGVVVANLITLDERLREKIAAMRAVFNHCHVWDSNGANVMFASNHEINFEQFCLRVNRFESQEKPGFELLEKAYKLKPSSPHKETNALCDKDL